MHASRLIRLLLPLLLSFLAPLTSADESREIFAFEDAVRYAYQNNLDLRALEQRAAAVHATIAAQRELNNPNFVGETTRSQPNYFLGLGYLFEPGGKRGTRIGVAKSEADIADLATKSTQKTLRHDVRLAFYQYLQSQAKLQQTSKARDLASRLLDISKERFEVGDVPKLEVLQAELELKRRENEMEQSANDLKASGIRFNLLLNRPPQASFQLEGSIENQASSVSLESLLDKSVAERPEVQSARAEIAAQEQRLSLARKSRIPDLQVEGGTEIHDADFQYGWRFNLAFDLPIFNQHTGEIASAGATLESLKSEELSQRRKVESEVTESYVKFQTAGFRTENYRSKLLPAVTQLEEMSEESYHEGKTPLVSALDAQRNSFEVRIEYLGALMDYQSALADLERAVGIDLP